MTTSDVLRSPILAASMYTELIFTICQWDFMKTRLECSNVESSPVRSSVSPFSAVIGEPAHEVELDMDVLVGKRIRDLRQARNLSLKSVAESSGLSIGLISQVERGLSSPSLRVLGMLSGALGVNIGHFFPSPANDQREVNSPIMRVGQRPAISLWRSGISKSVLTPERPGHFDLTLYTITIEPGGTTGDEAFTHDGEEAGVVLEGVLNLQIEDKVYILEAGDGFKFSSTQQHRFFNSSDAMTRVFWVNARESAV